MIEFFNRHRRLVDLTCCPSGLRRGFRGLEIPPNLEIRVRFPARAHVKKRAVHLFCGITGGRTQAHNLRKIYPHNRPRRMLDCPVHKSGRKCCFSPLVTNLGGSHEFAFVCLESGKETFSAKPKKVDAAERVRSLWDYGWNFHFTHALMMYRSMFIYVCTTRCRVFPMCPKITCTRARVRIARHNVTIA